MSDSSDSDNIQHLLTCLKRQDPGECTCTCTAATAPPSPPPKPDCHCPRDHLDIVIHEETCLLYKNETIIYPHEAEVCECPPVATRFCECCACLEDQCLCQKSGKDAFDEWRANRNMGAMPTVLESTHPLMQKFQESLRRFLIKESEMAEQEIIALRDDLKVSKIAYDSDLEGIYRSDHDTNGQRMLIEEYEATLANERKTREEAEERARISREKYKMCKEKLDAEMMSERDSKMEMEALNSLVRQLETWREETESDLTVSQRMTDKMKQEKRALIDEKRQQDMIIYGLNNEVWKLQAKLELFKKQMEIKNDEMVTVVDKVTAYQTELEDLELDKKRLISLWNSVLVNIKQRDRVYDTVRDDYRTLQENYRTLMCNLEITKRMGADEMQQSKLLAMDRDKLNYDIAGQNKLFEFEDQKREQMEQHIVEIQDAIDMTDRDQEMIKMETMTMRNILTTTEKECDRRLILKMKMENEILDNLQECLLNDKAVETMANGIKKMRDMSRKLEISLMSMENQHAKVMLNLEIHRNQQGRNAQILEKSLEKVREKEKELEGLQEKYDRKTLQMMRKQRELDIVQKKYYALKEIFDMKSPQERRIQELEQQIKALHERTESMQNEWLRMQGHVVKLTTHHQQLVTEICLINKQIQICDQKMMFALANIESVKQERIKVERELRDLRGRMQVLERARKEEGDRTHDAQRANIALSHAYAASLKDAESELLEIEEDIEVLEKEKVNLSQDLDHVTREALVWQRKGTLAVELKRNLKTAKSAVGEIGQMKCEIHKMEVRREQLRRSADKLAEDLALYIMRRETAMEKCRASAAVEKARGSGGLTSQSNYKHKLRLLKSDVQRVTKELAESKSLMKQLREDQERLEAEIAKTSAENAQLEENVAALLRECRQVDRDKQWMLERLVRCQRLGGELGRAVKRQSLRVRKPKPAVLAEYNQAHALNDRLRHIVDQLSREYPYMEEKLEIISNTLNILSPNASPRLTAEATCELLPEEGGPGCVIPEELEEEQAAEKPYCQQEKDTCIECKCTDTEHIVDQLSREYPYMEEKLEIISNTLNILSPNASPRLTAEATCELLPEEGGPGCVIPEELEEEQAAEKPYCQQEKDTCIECKCTDTEHIVDQLSREYPYMEEKLEIISNTLNILSPNASPRLTAEATCELLPEEGGPGCVIPEELEEEQAAEKPYCQQEKDTCIECKCTDTE